MPDGIGDLGVISALLHRLIGSRIPRLLELKRRVDNGEILGEFDLHLLERILADDRSSLSYVERRPDVKPLYAQINALCHEIVSKGLENESRIRKRN